MDKLKVLNDAIMKQDNGLTVPMSLKISLKGQWHTVTIDREDKNVQNLVRVLVSMMLRSEIEKACRMTVEYVKKSLLEDYKVCVITEMRESREEIPWGGLRSPDYPVSETVKVRAYNEQDARVMAFILVGHVPKESTPTWLIAMADQYAEVMP